MSFGAPAALLALLGLPLLALLYLREQGRRRAGAAMSLGWFGRLI